MATRNERVVLTLDDQFSSRMARAAAATAVLNKELHNLDGTNADVGDGLDRTSDSIKRSGDESRKSGPDIDKFSGRLRTLVDIGITAGPALIPLGASTIPVLTGAIAGLGAASGALGVTVLAFQGLGDAIKALDEYRLEPTAQNLEKLRIEQEKLGPAGAEFARYLANLEPTLRDLQNIAREGLFPGIEDGIDALLGRGPQVERIIADIAEGMGNIARDTGEGLASDKFDAFFNYIESDARPTMEAFAASTGNVALGIANMIVAFAPLSRDFTGGLEDATRAFADWSATLDTNQSFQDFVAYIRESGPQAIAFIGSLVQALVGLLQAAAPFGSVVLPILTQVLGLFADIAQSDAGPALYAAAAGLIAFNRASAVTARYGPQLTATFAGLNAATIGKSAAGIGLLALSMSDLDDKAGLTNTTMGAFAGLVAGGPTGLAIGAAVGQILDLKSAYEQLADVVTQAEDALRSDSIQQTQQALSAVSDTLNELDNPRATLLGPVADNLHRIIGAVTGETDKLRERQAELQDSMRNTGGIADLFGETIGQTGDQLRVAAGGAEEFSGALARLNGWFDKRDAVRAYKDAIDELRDSMKNGFSREDAANLDNIGRSILQVAQNIKNPGARATFLAEARAQLVDMANNAAPKAKAAIREVIAQFDDKGLTHPKIEITADDRRARQTIDPLKQDLTIMGRSITEPKIGADDNPFRQVYGTVKGAMREANNLRANPKITADAGQALSAINSVLSRLGLVHDKSVTITTYHNDKYGGQAGGGGHTAPGVKEGSADGTTVPKTGLGYADRHLYLLADGEEVISNRYGQADRHRSLLKAINANRLADGGTSGGDDSDPKRKPRQFHANYTLFSTPEIADLLAGAKGAAGALKVLQSQVDRAEKAVDRQKQKLDSLTSAMGSLASSVSSKFDVNLGDTGAGFTTEDLISRGFDPTTAAQMASDFQKSTRDNQIATLTEQASALPGIIDTLKSWGLTGPALAEVLTEMSVDQLQQLVAGGAGQVQQLATGLGALYSAQSAAGMAAGNAVYGDQVTAQTKELREAKHELKEANQRLRGLEKIQKHLDALEKRSHEEPKETGQAVAGAISGAAGAAAQTGGRTKAGKGRK